MAVIAHDSGKLQVHLGTKGQGTRDANQDTHHLSSDSQTLSSRLPPRRFATATASSPALGSVMALRTRDANQDTHNLSTDTQTLSSRLPPRRIATSTASFPSLGSVMALRNRAEAQGASSPLRPLHKTLVRVSSVGKPLLSPKPSSSMRQFDTLDSNQVTSRLSSASQKLSSRSPSRRLTAPASSPASETIVNVLSKEQGAPSPSLQNGKTIARVPSIGKRLPSPSMRQSDTLESKQVLSLLPSACNTTSPRPPSTKGIVSTTRSPALGTVMKVESKAPSAPSPLQKQGRTRLRLASVGRQLP
jgi:hypothetical protein